MGVIFMRSNKKILTKLTNQVIHDVLAEGDISHADDDWADESIETNLNHLQNHLESFIYSTNKIVIEEDLRHIVCRAAMLYYSWLKENGKLQ
jgi:hypothetical protein